AVAGALLLCGLVAWQLADVLRKLDELRDLRLVALPAEAETPERELLFGAVGARPFARRPPSLLDEYVVLERPGTRRAPEGTARTLATFAAAERDPATGVWIFAGPSATIGAARARLEDVPGAEVATVSPSVLLVRSAEPLEPRALVELAAELREAWLEVAPEDREAERLLRRAQYALGAG
ncbi:MAG TPA: hypothetical protein VD769_04930, partial [Gaiellaceae bacterium]|nr:hypothetical protein [Gaiellaceae bacterium]